MTGARHGTRLLGNETTVVVGMTHVALDNVPTVGFAGATTTQRETVTADSTLTLCIGTVRPIHTGVHVYRREAVNQNDIDNRTYQTDTLQMD